MDRRIVLGSAAVVLAVAAAVCTQLGPSAMAQAKPKDASRSCFYARDVSSWAPAGNETVNLRVNVRDYYQLKLAGPCPNIDWDQGIGIEHRGSNWICSGLDATIIARGPSGPNRCPAISVRKLSPEEVAALPPRQKP